MQVLNKISPVLKLLYKYERSPDHELPTTHDSTRD